MTAQEIGTFVRFGSNAICVLINNDGYGVERYISPNAHACEWLCPRRGLDGTAAFYPLQPATSISDKTCKLPPPVSAFKSKTKTTKPQFPSSITVSTAYNYVQRWDYAAVAAGMCNGTGRYKVFKATTFEEAEAAIVEAKALADHFVFLEVVVSRFDAAPAAGAVRRQFGSLFAPFSSMYKVGR